MHFTHNNSKPGISRIFFRIAQYICLSGLMALAGCGTFNARNTASRPWDQPIGMDFSQGQILHDDYDSSLLTDYPGN
jgi:hypothetical protein